MTVAERAWARLWPGTALIIPVQDAEPAVTRWLGRPPDFDGIPLHVTVLAPFLPGRRVGARTRATVAALARRTPPFAFHLTGLRAFPGVHYLAPEPAGPFVALTRRFWRAWPGYPPYRGAFDTITPHVTVALGDLPAGEAALAADLPIAGRATELRLVEQVGSRWRTRLTFPLGGTDHAGPADAGPADPCDHAGRTGPAWSAEP